MQRGGALGDAGEGGSRYPIMTVACLALRARLLLRQEGPPPSQGSLVVWRQCAPLPSAAPATGAPPCAAAIHRITPEPSKGPRNAVKCCCSGHRLCARRDW